jgi:hypothetical protein
MNIEDAMTHKEVCRKERTFRIPRIQAKLYLSDGLTRRQLLHDALVARDHLWRSGRGVQQRAEAVHAVRQGRLQLVPALCQVLTHARRAAVLRATTGSVLNGTRMQGKQSSWNTNDVIF